MNEADAVVVGAGPAGTSAAFFLKKALSESEIILMDRLEGERYDRYHRICGEAVSSRAFEELRPLEPWGVLNRIRRAVEKWPGGIEITSKAEGYIIDRPEFLREMIRRYVGMGGRYLNDAVAGIERVGSRYRVVCRSGDSFLASYIVGADGANSIVRRSLFDLEPRFTVPVRQFVIEGASDPETMVFRYDARYGGGYRWEFPCGDKTKVGFPLGTDDVPDSPIISQGRRIPVGGLPRSVKGNACLVGDAAAQANPLTFGGIRVAMLAGKASALSIANGDLPSYEKWWKGSGFSDPLYFDVFTQLASLSNEELERSAIPFKKGYGFLPYLRAWFKNPEFRRMFKAYRLSEKYGW